jgi:hypothetical protein
MKVSCLVSMPFFRGGCGNRFYDGPRGKTAVPGASPPEAIGAVRGTRPNNQSFCRARPIRASWLPRNSMARHVPPHMPAPIGPNRKISRGLATLRSGRPDCGLCFPVCFWLRELYQGVRGWARHAARQVHLACLNSKLQPHLPSARYEQIWRKYDQAVLFPESSAH